MGIIRDALPTDAARLAEIRTVSWQAAYQGLLADTFLAGLTIDARLDWWNARLARVPPRWAVLVAQDLQSVTGYATTGHCQDPDRNRTESGELYAVYVDPRYWGFGFGRQLLTGAEDRLRADGFSDASLWVFRDNQRARRFYELAGWGTDGAEKRMVIGSDAVTAVRYVRDL